MREMIVSFSSVLMGGGWRSAISNLEPAIIRECWLVMHNVVMISFNCRDSGEEFPRMMLTILCVVGVDCLDLVGSWKR